MRPSGFLRVVSIVAVLAGFSLRAEEIVLVAGGSEPTVDVAANRAQLREPFGIGFDRAGHAYVIEMASGNRLLRIDADGVLRHVAGQPTAGDSGDGGPALTAQFHGPHNLAVLPDGDVLVADTWNGRVRRFHARTNQITAVDGFRVAPEQARAAGPYCIALDPTGTRLYVADLRRVHVVDLASGRARTVAGNGQKAVPSDGAIATDAPLVDPRAVAVDGRGNVYILERSGHALRVVAPDGKIRTVVNRSGKKGTDGDGGDALAATMNGPKHICIDRDDTVIIADAENHLVRRYDPRSGKITRVAGTGKKGTAGIGGPPTECELNRPHGVAVAPDGTLYIVDSYNNRVLRIVR